MPTPDEMQAYADQEYRAGVYEQYTQARALKVATFRRRVAIIRRYVPTGRLLDLGCACGFMLEAALEAGFDAWGLEFSGEAIAAAAPRVRHRIRAGNVDGVRDGAYDVVTAFDILEHNQDPLKTLAGWSTALRPGGVLVVTTPDTDSWLRPLMGQYWPQLQARQHTVLFSSGSMPATFARVGLDTLVVEPAVKVMSLAYLLGQLEVAIPAAARVGRALTHLLPGPMAWPIPFRIGEFLIVGRKRG